MFVIKYRIMLYWNSLYTIECVYTNMTIFSLKKQQQNGHNKYIYVCLYLILSDTWELSLKTSKAWYSGQYQYVILLYTYTAIYFYILLTDSKST